MKPLIKTQHICLSFFGFRDLEWIDTINTSLPQYFYNKTGIPIIYSGCTYITPDAFVDRIVNGTEDTDPEEWVGVPADYSLCYNVYDVIEKEMMLQLLHDWAKCDGVTTAMHFSMSTYNESYDGSLDVCDHECDKSWHCFIHYKDGELVGID